MLHKVFINQLYHHLDFNIALKAPVETDSLMLHFTLGA